MEFPSSIYFIWFKIAERIVCANYIVLNEFKAIIMHLYCNKPEEPLGFFLSFTAKPQFTVTTFSEILFFVNILSHPRKSCV
jgi:hypothetical protein